VKREGRRADRRRRREFAEQELENPFLPETFGSDGPIWNDLWTKTTSNNDEYTVFSRSDFLSIFNVIFRSCNFIYCLQNVFVAL
jgi:hypothetical protein